MSTKTTGAFGEKAADKYLTRRGYKIIDRNFSFRAAGGPRVAEIDLIAKKKGVFVFVEVKTLRTRTGWKFVPQDKVNGQKCWKISKAAELWLLKNKTPLNVKWRIDVVAVEILDDDRPKIVRWLFGPKLKISHFENATSG